VGGIRNERCADADVNTGTFQPMYPVLLGVTHFMPWRKIMYEDGTVWLQFTPV
jgi:hypothetical protein